MLDELTKKYSKSNRRQQQQPCDNKQALNRSDVVAIRSTTNCTILIANLRFDYRYSESLLHTCTLTGCTSPGRYPLSLSANILGIKICRIAASTQQNLFRSVSLVLWTVSSFFVDPSIRDLVATERRRLPSIAHHPTKRLFHCQSALIGFPCMGEELTCST